MTKIFTLHLIFLLQLFGTCYNKKEYILNTPKCKIPNLEPFTKEVVDLMKPHSYVSCNTSELLTAVKKNESSAILYVKEDLIPLYTSNNISCCYSYVLRNGSLEEPDVGIAISPCYSLDKQVLLIHDTVKVTCSEYDDNNTMITVYENVHNPVIVKESIKQKLKNNTDTSKPFSVLFVVVDSVSRLNFIRTMNQTYEFLKENNFIEMKGYTKVADNTYPNFASFLTGLSWNKLQQKCKAEEVGGLDKCPMIWNDYRNLGYITAYAEDDTPITTFNYQKKGFKNPPTDYYFKPYVEASETLEIVYSNLMPYCTGPESAGERILNLAKDFAITFKNQSTFGIFWMNTFSHNEVNAPYGMDGKMKNFFTDLKDEGVLDDSIVIFLSDHGIRFGDIRLTQSGWFEERMPINMISVPIRFQDRFAEEYHNLRENGDKLTSTYDLYMTLQHILTLSGISYTNKKSSGCRQCTSLFKKIPLTRSCKDAGIPEEWCTCIGRFEAIEKNDEHVQNATELAMQKINTVIASYKAQNLSCEKLTLNETLSSSISEYSGRNTRHLFTVLKTLPQATFLVTVKFQHTVTPNSTFYIRRINYNLNYCIEKIFWNTFFSC